MALRRLSWKELRTRPLRTLLTLSSIVIGVAAVIAVSKAIENTRFAQKAMLQAIAGRTSFELYSEGGLPFEPNILKEISDFPEIAIATAVVRRDSVMSYHNKQSVRVQYLGVDPKLDQEVREYRLVEGEMFADYDQFLLYRDFAKSLRLNVGDQVRFLTKSGLRDATLVGLVEPKSGVGATQGGIAIVPMPTAQKWGRSGQRVDLIQLIVRDNADEDSVAEKLQAILPQGIKLRVPPLRSELGQESTVALDQGLRMASAFSFIIGIFIIYNTFQMSVGERRRHLGILRALGTTRLQIVRMIVFEGLALGIIGTLLGWGLGLYATRWLTQATAQMMDTEIASYPTIGWFPLVLSASCGIGVALFGAYFPAKRASRLSPAEAMRVVTSGNMEPNPKLLLVLGTVFSPVGLTILVLCVLGKIHIDHAIIGTILFLLGYIFMLPSFLPFFLSWIYRVLRPLLGVEGNLAQRQLLRYRVRSAFTIGILFIALSTGLGMSCTILDSIRNFRSWTDNAVTGDFFIRATMPSMDSGQAADLPSDSLERFREIPGIKTFDTARYITVRANNFASVLVTRDFSGPPRKLFQITHGEIDQVHNRLQEGEVVIGSVLAERARLTPGQTINLETAVGPVAIKIAAIANDYIHAGLTIYMNRRQAEKLFSIEGANLVIIDAVPGKSSEVAKALQAVCDADGLLLQTQSQLLKLLRSKVDNLVGGLWAILGLCSVIAAFGLINTLIMNILEQTAEIGMLRAVAMTRGQVRKMILSQAVFMGLIGLVPGVLAGILIAYLLALSVLPTTGHAVTFEFRPWLIFGSLMLELLIVLIASLIPAERAARIPVSKAMQF